MIDYPLEVLLKNGQWYHWKTYKAEKSARQAMKDIYRNNSHLMSPMYRIGSSLFEIEQLGEI